ncbi:hypothetical protein BN1050_02316 [Metalysinibacillus saudimassiliensis]|uniref:Transposase n=1 Tax=Metalysinibacillus saudimassiliensis TaxID=1461583 RepID=A0A078MK43_9BACL|nr:hypothetical protein BN1050_02316 [Metalysinibacillus saudimassiliensis]
MPTITAKIQLYVNESQAESLRLTSKTYQKACNWLSEKVVVSKNLNQRQLNNLYYKELRQRFGLKTDCLQEQQLFSNYCEKA